MKKDGVSYLGLSSHCQFMLFNQKAFSISEVAQKIHPDFYRADFCYKKYSAQQVAELMQKLRCFEVLKNTVSANVERNIDLF